jgi:hypothetical protein
MSKNLTILFAPLDLIGPINALTAIGEVLRDRGHKVVFAVSDQWKGKLNIHGFEEEIMELSENKTNEDPAKYWSEYITKSGLFGPRLPIEKLKDLHRSGFDDLIIRPKNTEPLMVEIVDRIKPDIIICDTFFGTPSLMKSGIPWVLSMSCNPLCIDYTLDDKRIPPSCLGSTLFNLIIKYCLI